MVQVNQPIAAAKDDQHGGDAPQQDDGHGYLHSGSIVIVFLDDDLVGGLFALPPDDRRMLARLAFPLDDGGAVPITIAITRFADRHAGTHGAYANANSRFLGVRSRHSQTND